jgi:Fic family protein
VAGRSGTSLGTQLAQGSIARGKAARITGLKEHSAWNLLATLLADGILASDTPKGPVPFDSH